MLTQRSRYPEPSPQSHACLVVCLVGFCVVLFFSFNTTKVSPSQLTRIVKDNEACIKQWPPHWALAVLGSARCLLYEAIFHHVLNN